MASTYSTNLAIELIGTGDQAGTWGNTTNTNLGTLIEQAISGYVTQAVSTGTDTTITIPNGATGVARNMYIELTGTVGTNTNLIVPSNKKLYFIFNNASGAVTVKVSGQTGVSVPAGKKVVLASNGTDTVNALNYIADFGSNSATITQLTATSATITNLTLTSLVISNLSIASANVTVLTSASATITNLLATSLTVSSGSTLNGGVVINEPGADVDFRVEGDTDANLIFADASTDRVGVGLNNPGAKLHVSAADGTAPLTLNTAGGSDTTRALNFNVAGDNYGKILVPSGSGGAMAFWTGAANAAAERLRISADGNLGLGVTPSAWGSIFNAMQLGDGGFIAGRSDTATQLQLGCNGFYDGSNFKYIVTGTATRYYMDTGAHYWENAASGTAGNTISFTQAMTLTVNGDLGLGTTTPSNSVGYSTLSLSGSTGGQLVFQTAGTYKQTIYSSATDLNILNGQAGNLTFGTNNTERARITTGGFSKFSNTGTYANSTGAYHELYSTTGNAAAVVVSNAGTNGQQYGITIVTANDQNDAARYFWSGEGGGVERGTLRSNGGLANYSANNVNLASDERLKKDISPLDSAWGKVKEMEVVNFRYKDCNEGDPLLYGVIAQQVQPIVPELVVVTQEAKEATEDKEATPEYYGIREQPMYWLAIKALQEAMTKIETLEAKVAALETK